MSLPRKQKKNKFSCHSLLLIKWEAFSASQLDTPPYVGTRKTLHRIILEMSSYNLAWARYNLKICAKIQNKVHLLRSGPVTTFPVWTCRALNQPFWRSSESLLGLQPVDWPHTRLSPNDVLSTSDCFSLNCEIIFKK